MLNMGLASYAFEFIMIVVIIVIGLVLTIYATQAHSQCKKALDGKYEELSEDDIKRYTEAMANLQQIIWIGWTIVAIGGVFLIGLFIISFFLAPEEALLAMEGTFGPEIAGFISEYGSSLYQTGKDFGRSLSELNATSKKAKNGLYFHAAFGGVVTQLIFFVLFGTVFFLGIYAAMASVKLSNTEGQHGYEKAKAAALLGIIPFSVFVVWFIADKAYSHMYTASAEHQKEKVIEDVNNTRQELIEEGRYTPRRPAPPTPPQTPRRAAPRIPPPRPSTPKPNLTHQSQSPSFADTLLSSGVGYLQSPEGSKMLAAAGQSMLRSLTAK